MNQSAQGSLLDRTIILAAGGFLVLVAVLVAASLAGWEGAGSLRPVLLSLGAGALEAGAGALLLLLAGLHLLFFGLRRERDEGIRQETEIGHVRISLKAMESLVYRTAREIRGIKDVGVRVHPSPEGVAIALSLVVHPDVVIPKVSEEVGLLVRSRVRETVGVNVGDVAIEVRNISTVAKGRVE